MARKKYEDTILMSKKQFEHINKLLNIDDFENLSDAERNELGVEENSEKGIFSAAFTDGLVLSLRLLSGQHNYYTDAEYTRLGDSWQSFDEADFQLSETEEFIIGGVTYVVHLKLMDDIDPMTQVTLSADDAAFMSGLRKELLSQPTDGNRDPRFWVVMEKALEYGFDKEYADGWGVFDTSFDGVHIGQLDDLQSVKNALCDPDAYAIGTSSNYADCNDEHEVVERANELCGEDRFSVVYYRKRNVARENTFFLTKRACDKHIAENRHNYNEPFSYVMTAERSPEFERALNIIKGIIWEP